MKRTWWKEAIIYQIYPRSFKDTNGDGVGDLPGIIEKLDYLKELGIDVLWLSPVYASPNHDNGYDISDYYAIHEEFGTMEDFDQLLAGLHERDMKLVMDLVVNHTSIQHEWFQKARKSADNPFRDFYFWESEPPNNWQSIFGGPAWTYDEKAEAYYLHLFTPEQPDLNWDNPKVREEIYQMMRFWLDKGIDGFRMDVISLISKRTDWPDADFSDFNEAIEKVYANGPQVHKYLKEMHQEVLADYDIMTIGEGVGVPPKKVRKYVAPKRKELDMIFHFGHMFIDHGSEGKFDIKKFSLSDFKEVFATWDEAVGKRGWLNIYLDNHDFPRMISRFGNDGLYREESAKLLATLLFTLRGTPCIYQGSEIGMTNASFPDWEDYRDIEVFNARREYEERFKDHRNKDKKLAKLFRAVQQQGRDNQRTPMQWDDSENAGFTSGTPWIKVNPNYPKINVEVERAKDQSIFAFYQQLIEFRRQHPTLIYGKYQILDGGSDQLYAYRRYDDDGEFFIYLNFGSDRYEGIPLPADKRFTLALSNYRQRAGAASLRPWEARVYQVIQEE